MILLSFLFWLGLGIPVAWSFYNRRRVGLAMAMIPLAGLSAIAFALMIAVGVPAWLVYWPQLAVLVSAIQGVLTWWLLRGLPVWNPRVPGVMSAKGDASISTVFGIWFGLNVGIGVFLAAGRSAYGWDGYMIWVLHAKVFAESQVLPVSLFSEPELALSHWDYPVLFSGFLGWFMRVGDVSVDRLALPLGVLIGMLPLVQLAGCRGVIRHRSAAILGLCPLLVLGLIDLHHDAYADPLLTVFVLMAFVWGSLGLWTDDKALQFAAGLVMVLAVLTKNEAILWLLALCGGLLAQAVLMRKPVHKAVASVVRVALPGLCVFLIWRLQCRVLGVDNDVTSGLQWGDAAERVGVVASAVAGYVFTLDHVLLIVIAVGLIVWAISGSVARKAMALLGWLFVPIAMVVGMSLVYIGTPHDVNWHLETSLDRTFSGIVPAMLIAGVLAVVTRDPDGEKQ